MAINPRLVGAVQLFAVLVAAVFLKPALENRDKPGSRGFIIFLIGVGLLAAGQGLRHFTRSMLLKTSLYKIALLGAEVAAAGWLLTALAVVRGKHQPRRIYAVVGGVILVFQVLLLTNPVHHLMLAGYTLSGTYLIIQYATGFWLHAVVGYLFALGGTGLLARETLRSTGLRRKQMLLLTLAIVPVLIANIITVFDLISPLYDLSPLGYLVAAGVFVLVLFQGRFLDIVTVARRTAMAEMDDAVVTLDDQNRVVDANPTSRELFDVRDDYVGLPAPEFFSPLPDEILERFAETTDIDTDVTVTLDGEQRHFSLSISPIGTHADQGRVFVFRDITQQKDREQQLQRQNERLDQFASVVSHDLRNPLMVTRGNVELIADAAPDERVETIEHNLDRMETIIDDMLTMARAGQTIEDTEPVALAALARDAWEHADTAEATLDVCLSDDVTIQADYDRLLHVFENLFRNALDHNDPPVTLRTGLLEDLDAMQMGFFIEDDGRGISPEDRDDVFEHGYTTSDDGTGLGLSLVEDIVHAHGWEITITESDQGGARFEITGIQTDG